MTPKFQAIKKLDGFDDSVVPHWLMLGERTEKSVVLLDGDDRKVSVKHPTIAEIVGDVKENVLSRKRIITIRGKTKGSTFVEVAGGGRLEVCVKRRRDVRVSFHFVHDNAGHGTIRKHSQLTEWLNVINNVIFLPQANVFVKSGVVNDPLRISRDLGTVIRDTRDYAEIPKSEHEVDLIMSFGDKSADINVFFVTDVENARDATQNKIGGTQYPNGIFIDDVLKNPLATIVNVLAHEIGHFLGVGADSHYFKKKNIDGLMYYKARGGMRISKIHANMINR